LFVAIVLSKRTEGVDKVDVAGKDRGGVAKGLARWKSYSMDFLMIYINLAQIDMGSVIEITTHATGDQEILPRLIFLYNTKTGLFQ
jgi:hypothetical protein